MIYNLQKSKDICKYLESGLPEIEGVKWKIHIVDLCGEYKKKGISLEAIFEINETSEIGDFVNEVGCKLHEIVSNGQIKLELE